MSARSRERRVASRSSWSRFKRDAERLGRRWRRYSQPMWGMGMGKNTRIHKGGKP